MYASYASSITIQKHVDYVFFPSSTTTATTTSTNWNATSKTCFNDIHTIFKEKYFSIYLFLYHVAQTIDTFSRWYNSAGWRFVKLVYLNNIDDRKASNVLFSKFSVTYVAVAYSWILKKFRLDKIYYCYCSLVFPAFVRKKFPVTH